jgi:hypothetical protein
MPRLDLWAWLVWSTATAVEIAVGCALLKARSASRYGAVFAFILVQSAKDLVLMAVAAMPLSDRHAATYFYTYWIVTGVLCLIRLWIIVQLIQSACSAAVGIRRWAPYGAIVVALIACAAALISSVDAPRSYSWWVMESAVIFGRCTALTWGIAFVVLAWSGELLGFRWSGRNRAIAIGLGLQAVGESLMSWFLSSFPWIHVFSLAQDLLYLSSLLAWLWAFCVCTDAPEILDIHELRTLAEPYIELSRSLKESL